MRRDVEKLKLNSEQLLRLSYQTCQWWNAVFVQAVASFEDIKNMRDMNEHGLDYLVGKGKKPDQYQLTVHTKHGKLITTPAWTFSDGNEGIMLFGNVEIVELLSTMKEQLPLVFEKTKEIFNKGSLEQSIKGRNCNENRS